MVAVLVQASAGSWDWLLVSLVVAGLGLAGMLGTTRAKRLVILLVVALGLGLAGTAYAIPYYYCDPIWKYLGWC